MSIDAQTAKMGQVQKIVEIKDPRTHKTLCKIKNPKVPIKGFDNIQKTIDLKDNVENYSQPNFGFDTFQQNQSDPGTFFLSKICGQQQGTLKFKLCINKTLEIRKKFNQFLYLKFQSLPTWLKKCPEVISLLDKYQVKEGLIINNPSFKSLAEKEDNL